MKVEDVNKINNANSFDAALSIKNDIDRRNQYDVDLSKMPSKGKIYPDGVKMYLNKLKPSMLNKLATMTVDTMDNVCNDVISKTLVGYDYREIGVGDKWYMIYLLRDISFGHRPHKVNGTCKNCEKNKQYEYTFDKLNVIHLPESFEKVINLEISGDSVLIDLPRIKNEFVANSMKKDIIASRFDESIINLSINIGSVNGKELTPVEKCEYIENLDPIDYSILMDKLSEVTNYGITFSAIFECDCGEKNNILVPLNEDFFLPKFR